MININQGATNSIVLRFSDNITAQNPIFLFELTSIQSNHVYYFTAEDSSTTTRYNQFTIYEIGSGTQSISLTASVPSIKLEYGGSYLYRVYQTDNYSLQPTNVILDSGMMMFRGSEYQTFFFELGDDNELGIFDNWEQFYTFESGDDIQSSIFDQFSELSTFEFNENPPIEIFDPELVLETYYILTEDGEILMTESGDNLIWN